MKIGILSRNARLYSTRRLVEAAKSRGHQVQVIDALLCHLDIVSRKPAIHYKGQVLKGFDAIIPRIGASVTFYASAVLRQFEMMGVYCVNESVSISRSRDKLRAMQILSRHGVGMPVTGCAHSTKMTQDLMRSVGGAPLVVKLIEGTQGKGVVLAETDQAAESVIDAFRGLDAFFLVQEFIKESGGSDIRAFVVGSRIVGSMIRTAKEGEFRSNLHRGGSAVGVTLTPLEKKTALKAARALGLVVAGVDMLRSSKGPLVIEVNSSPGLQGIERATKKDIAMKIINYVEQNVTKPRSKAKG